MSNLKPLADTSDEEYNFTLNVTSPASGEVVDVTKNLTIYWNTNATAGLLCSIYIAQDDPYSSLELPGAGEVPLSDGRFTAPPLQDRLPSADNYYILFTTPDSDQYAEWSRYSNEFTVKNDARVSPSTTSPSAAKPTAPAANTTTPAASTSAASHSGLTEGAKVGIGIGVGVGVPVLLALAGLLFLFARRRNVPAPQNPAYQPAPGDMYFGSPASLMASVPGQQAGWVQPEPVKDNYVPPIELADSNKAQNVHEMPT